MTLILDSIIIFVQDVERLKCFYNEKLNLELLEEIKSEWALLNAGKCKIALHKVGKQYQSSDPGFKVNGNTKIVFVMDEGIFDQREILFKKSVTISEVKSFDNYDFCFCDGEDPEGNVFQLKQKKAS